MKHVRVLRGRAMDYERAYSGIGKRKRLLVVARINVPPGDYIAPLVGVRWKGSTAWLYEKDTVES